ncbi:Proton-dependent oligopeptide transporter family [Macleaya cordata]|uniref:Proton-dependent oligopeptide transporter family n=1 Tax=Macleaya cordata TaxID=56857 RepID=A0A200QJ18_MACCD|nr:Proton-dependent oligopeptide transporter family [Macleaya cordata]
MEGLENMAFIANAVSLVTYFYGFMNLSLTKSATTLTNFMGTSFLLALFGGFISDTYLSRFKTCVLFGCIELVGYALLAVQAHFGALRPFPPCNSVAAGSITQCEPANDGQTAILLSGLYLIALGTGGIKAGLPSLGADQFDHVNEAALVSSFFNWFMFSLSIGAVIGVTFVVWISTNQGWDWGFGMCFIAVFFAIVFICMGKSFYRHNVPKGSAIVRIVQVFVVAFRNRNLPIPEMTDELHDELHDKEAALIETEILQRTDQFRFLDRAAVLPTNPHDIVMTSPLNAPRESLAWNLCTVTQVEETKILIRMLPIILSTVFMNTCLAQLQTFSIQQSVTMDTHLFGGFHIPGPSLPVIPLLFMAILVPLYDRVFVPVARKFTGIPTGIRHLQRVGIGLVLSAISMAIAGIMETRRKSVAVHHNMVDSSDPLPMSIFWLGFQYGIFGAADCFTFVGLLEFFYAESSAGMKSLGTAISMCSLAFGYYLSTVVVEVVNKVSGGWLASNNLNRDKLNYFYYLLAGLSVVNFGFYLLCASWYRYKKVEPQMELLGSSKGDKAEIRVEMMKLRNDQNI